MSRENKEQTHVAGAWRGEGSGKYKFQKYVDTGAGWTSHVNIKGVFLF